MNMIFGHASISKIINFINTNKHADFGSFIMKRAIPSFNTMTGMHKEVGASAEILPFSWLSAVRARF